MRRTVLGLLAVVTVASSLFTLGCAKPGNRQVVLYTNADEEAVTAIRQALDNAGYQDKYILQSYGTGELGGKLLAEGTAIEADLITMSSYLIESAQAKHAMFADLAETPAPLKPISSYQAPILAITGALFVNTEMLKEKNLPAPVSIADLTKPAYKDSVAIPNIASSSTAWLMLQAVLSAYPEAEAKTLLANLAANCGPHIEKSGSGPIKKVRAGEVAVGFGLRHQAIADQQAGKPISCVDPVEGNFTLTESVAVVKKDGPVADLAQKMAAVIVRDARKDLLATYPVVLYAGEQVAAENVPAYPKEFAEPLTIDLLNKHIEFFNGCRP